MAKTLALRKTSSVSASSSSEGTPPLREAAYIGLIEENPQEQENCAFSREATSFLNGLDFGDEENSKKENRQPNERDSKAETEKAGVHKE